MLLGISPELIFLRVVSFILVGCRCGEGNKDSPLGPQRGAASYMDSKSGNDIWMRPGWTYLFWKETMKKEPFGGVVVESAL